LFVIEHVKNAPGGLLTSRGPSSLELRGLETFDFGSVLGLSEEVVWVKSVVLVVELYQNLSPVGLNRHIHDSHVFEFKVVRAMILYAHRMIFSANKIRQLGLRAYTEPLATISRIRYLTNNILRLVAHYDFVALPFVFAIYQIDVLDSSSSRGHGFL